jgi:anthranilate synthase component 1
MNLAEMSFVQFDRLATRGVVPVFRQIAADTETPISAGLKLGVGARGFLLESLAGGEHWGRFSFLSDRPSAVLRLDGETATIEQGGRETSITEAPLAALRRLAFRRKLARVEGLPRFVGGLVGYLSYDAVRWFEPRVPQRHGVDETFPASEWMVIDRLVAFDNLAHKVNLICCTDASRHSSARAAYRHATGQFDAIESKLRRPLPKASRHRPTQLRQKWDEPGFVSAVGKALEYIAAGDCMQVVLSRRLSARYRGDPFELYRRLRAVEPAPYAFYLRFGTRTLVGASPELLVRVEDRAVTVRPIAGTRPRGVTPVEDRRLEEELRRDPKERAEHVMLVDLGRNDVGRVSAPGSVQVDVREDVERYTRVMHLVSQVSGRLSSKYDALDALAASFPAGTVSGAPKVRAMEIVDELEPLSRGPYAGAAGYIGFDGSMEMAIMIRSLALAGTELRIQAGAGIVHDSDPRREWEETSHKMKATLAALGLSEPRAAGASPLVERKAARG